LAACGGGGSGSTSSAGTGSGGGGIAVGSLNGLSNPGCLYSYSLTAAPALTGNDPQLSSQWHLNNTGPSQSGGVAGEDVRAFAAWPTTRGSGTTVAVVDDAVEVLHADLAPNIVAGSFDYRPASFGGQFPLPCTVQDDHGTAVAGIIAARDNNQTGGAGVAPRAALIGLNALATNADADIADALTRQAAVVGIYNNSWGSPDSGGFLGVLPSNTFFAAIKSGTSSARGGRGAVYVFPGGNGRRAEVGSGTGYFVEENSNFDPYVNRNEVIAVCAVDSNGVQAGYSEQGANILLCGHSSSTSVLSTIGTTGVLSSFRSGSSGFTGTSASTPVVAGVAALVLARNPSLTWRDVRLILAQSARKNDPTDPEWTANPAFAPAGVNLRYNPKYGFGVADADAAVRLAGSWVSVGGTSAMRSCGPFSGAGVSIPDATRVGANTPTIPGAVVSSSIAVPNSCNVQSIEFVEITVSTSHPYAGDLQIVLSSPNGLDSLLANDRACAQQGANNSLLIEDCGNYANWQFGSVRHLGEDARGSWTLRLQDRGFRDQGSLSGWSITFYGR
jgi:subtilisin family serine protease/subtilisin-like proprotein convertase family protein